MLKHIPALLTPDALHALASLGHGDDVAIVDAHFPAARLAAAAGARLVELPGADAGAVLRAVLTLLPLDTTEPDPVRSMAVVGDAHAVPPVVLTFRDILQGLGLPAPVAVERHAFYAAARQAFVILRSGESRTYGNLLLRTGVCQETGP